VEEDWIAASARSVADWHDASVRALGVETLRTDGLWSREVMRPSIYVTAVALAPLREQPGIVREIGELVERNSAAPIMLWDMFNELDLTGTGLTKAAWIGESWIREAAVQPSMPKVPELAIERVEDEATLREFGFATYAGFESGRNVTEAGPLGMHHPATLADPRMHYFVGRVDGQVVTSSISYVGDDVVGIYGVSTLPDFRRRGYGAAITAAAAGVAQELPVVLQPDEMARGMYAQVGFRKLAEYRAWLRQP
jgi:GNAT superfamily N-acetyltransferase